MIPKLYLNTVTANAPIAVILFFTFNSDFIIIINYPFYSFFNLYVVYLHFAQSIGTCAFSAVQAVAFLCSCQVLLLLLLFIIIIITTTFIIIQYINLHVWHGVLAAFIIMTPLFGYILLAVAFRCDCYWKFIYVDIVGNVKTRCRLLFILKVGLVRFREGSIFINVQCHWDWPVCRDDTLGVQILYSAQIVYLWHIPLFLDSACFPSQVIRSVAGSQ